MNNDAIETAAKLPTAAQSQRQHHRGRNGQYKGHKCECCGKGAGFDYYSVEWLDEAPFCGRGQVLCARCAKKCEDRATAIKLLGLEEVTA